MQVAASLMGSALPPGTCAARLMLFVGGPSTEGAGKVVEKELSEPIRSHEVCMLCWLFSSCLLIANPNKQFLSLLLSHASALSLEELNACELEWLWLSGSVIIGCI